MRPENGPHSLPNDFPRKLVWFDALAEHLGTLAGPSVACGDFNICPTALDSWNEEKFAGVIFHTDAERARMGRLAEKGWTDLYRALYPEEKAYSWWDYRGGSFHRGHGLRIDFVLGTSGLRERTREMTIDRDYRKKQDGMTASDHAPCYADLS